MGALGPSAALLAAFGRLRNVNSVLSQPCLNHVRCRVSVKGRRRAGPPAVPGGEGTKGTHCLYAGDWQPLELGVPIPPRQESQAVLVGLASALRRAAQQEQQAQQSREALVELQAQLGTDALWAPKVGPALPSGALMHFYCRCDPLHLLFVWGSCCLEVLAGEEGGASGQAYACLALCMLPNGTLSTLSNCARCAGARGSRGPAPTPSLTPSSSGGGGGGSRRGRGSFCPAPLAGASRGAQCGLLH